MFSPVSLCRFIMIATTFWHMFFSSMADATFHERRVYLALQGTESPFSFFTSNLKCFPSIGTDWFTTVFDNHLTWRLHPHRALWLFKKNLLQISRLPRTPSSSATSKPFFYCPGHCLGTIFSFHHKSDVIKKCAGKYLNFQKNPPPHKIVNHNYLHFTFHTYYMFQFQKTCLNYSFKQFKILNQLFFQSKCVIPTI